MMGVVTNVGQLGSVKRKSDNSELSRRDITLLDQRWGSLSLSAHCPSLSFLPHALSILSSTIDCCEQSSMLKQVMSSHCQNDVRGTPPLPKVDEKLKWELGFASEKLFSYIASLTVLCNAKEGASMLQCRLHPPLASLKT